MPEIPLDIVEFVRHPELLNDQSHSEFQLAVLRSVYGLPLSHSELKIYRHGTARQTYDAQEEREITIVAGRRSGKTSKIAAPIVCFEAFRDHGLPPGEEGVVMLLACTIAQARIVFRYIRNHLRNSPILSKRIVNATKNEIKLDNNIVIGCYACTYDGVRGRTIVGAVCDEIGFWADEDGAANSAEEVVSSLLPRMVNVRHAKLVKISTPFARSGLLWCEFQERAELDFPVWQITTQDMNPTVTEVTLEKALRRDEEKFRREYLAEFTGTINTWVVSEILDPCVAPGRRELPFLPDAVYAAALDPASRHNDFALAVLHLSPDGKIVTDRIDRWAGTRTAPLAFEVVLAEVKAILDSYRICSVVGDQHCCDIISQHLLKLGIVYKIEIFGTQTRVKIFANLKHLMVQGRIELLDHVDLLRQLRSLREEKTDRGRVDIRPSRGMKDDLAVALALAASQLASQESDARAYRIPFLSPESGGGVRFNPITCHLQAVCGNFPCCLDDGACLGFKNELVTMSARA